MYFVAFQADSGFDRDDKILLYLPKGKFDISSAFVANNQSGLEGGFIVTQSFTPQNDIIGVERDGQGFDLPPNQPGSFRLAIMGNPTTPGNYTVDILTFRNGVTALNQGQTTITIKPGPLDHFAISTITNQVADALFPFRVTAKDFYNNNTRAFAGNITLSDNTGTLSPGSVALADTSVTVSSARITKAAGGVKITASATAGGKTKIGVSNSFNVNQIKILSIDTAPIVVSRRQPNIEVNMLVQNVGPDAVTLNTAGLSFKRNSDNGIENVGAYTVMPPSPSMIIGAALKTLKFSVTVNSTASLGDIEINGTVSGSVGGRTVSDNDADTKDSWRVQTAPAITYANPPGLTPLNVSAGSSYEFQVALRNSGEATLELKPDSTSISFGSGVNAFLAKLDANRVTTIPGNNVTTILTFRLTQVSPNLLQTSYTPAIKLIGVHNAVRFEQTITPPNIIVAAPPSLQIQSITSSQDVVTQGMRKLWTIKLVVKNNSAASVNLSNLKSPELSFIKLGTGGVTDNAYQIVKPTIFTNSKAAQLNGGLTDTLKFDITRTGNQTGIVGIFVKVYVNELPNPAESNGTQKSILVQTPAKLSLALRTSQNNVTEGQTQLWKIFMKVKNAGEAAARVVFDETKPNQTTRTSVLPGFTIIPAETDIILAGQDSTDIVFNVEQTGIFGDTPFDGQVFAREFNSDSLHFASGSSRINVQKQARVRVKSMQLSSIFNPDTVNTGQEFFVQANVEQTVVSGAEKVDSVKVRLVENPAAGNVTILTNDLTLTDLAQPVSFKVKAGNNTQVRAAFNAAILQAYSANTGASTVRVDGNANFTPPAVYIQRAGALVIDSLKTSESRVRFGRTSPWFISLIAQNSAGANGAVVVDSTRISFKIGQAIQNDYTIVNKNPADSLFFANQQKAWRFDVTKTGTSGGTVTITATMYFHDRNSLTKRSVSRTTTILVETTALVTIAQTTFPPTVNRLAGTEIALVDTGQVFPVNVTVRNTGFEQVKTAWVSLRSVSNKSKVLTTKAQTGVIATESGTAVAQFMVKAALETNLLGETFTARIDSAFNFANAKVSLGLALASKDTTVVARIELPARLQLSLMTADGATAYGFGQQFRLRARVKNLGQAQIDNSGFLTLALPQGKSYSFANGEIAQKSFAANDSVEWNIVAPNAESLDDALVVNLTAPLDKNSGNRAQVVNATAQITLSTRANTLRLDQKSIVAPAGAVDSILSTDQVFTIRVKIGASPNLTNKTVTLEWPSGSGFRLVNGEVATKNTPADTARWQVQAPSIENLKSVRLLFNLSAFSAQTPVSNLDSLVILRTEKQAILQIEPGLEGTGSPGNVVAVNQNFNIVATIRNTGRAAVVDSAIVTLNVPAALTIRSKTSQKVAFPTGTAVQKIIWQATAPAQPQLNTITFTITQKPFDANTGLEVLTSNDPATFTLTTESKGTVAADPPRITAPFGAQNDLILSTGQEFIISDTLRWANAANLTATLNLPAGFTIFNRVQNIPNPKEKDKTEVSWVVRAPAGPSLNVQASVLLQANDSHDASVPLSSISDSLQFNVVRRAEVSLSAEITDPPSATDGVLSVNQPFTVVATITNLGTAKVSGTAKVFLQLPKDNVYQLINPLQDTLSVAFPGTNICSWRVRARSTITTGSDLITVRLTQPPVDENTGTLTVVNDGEATLAIRTEGRKLIVACTDKGGGPAAQGQKNLMLMRLLLSNPAGGSNLKLQTLRFDLRKGSGTSPIQPGTVLQNVRIFNDGQRVGNAENILPDLSTLQIALSEDSVNIAPGIPDTLSIFADLTANATGTFRLSFDNGNDFDAIDLDGGGGVAIESAEGKQGSQFLLESASIALHEATDENSFFNYPNPFPPGNNQSNGEGTRFSVPLGASGELKILTLLGELVWETKFDTRRTSIFWDGNNGAGQRVLNGVYVAILKTNAGKMLTTKVAVLKR